MKNRHLDESKYLVGLCPKCMRDVNSDQPNVVLGGKPYHRKCCGKEEEVIE